MSPHLVEGKVTLLRLCGRCRVFVLSLKTTQEEKEGFPLVTETPRSEPRASASGAQQRLSSYSLNTSHGVWE